MLTYVDLNQDHGYPRMLSVHLQVTSSHQSSPFSSEAALDELDASLERLRKAQPPDTSQQIHLMQGLAYHV